MNKKGFTLVELLAVIAILAILVIIALPNVLKMFNDAKKNSFLTEAKTVYSEVSKKYISESMKGNKLSYVSSEDDTKLEMTGRDLQYCVLLNTDGTIKSMKVSNGEWIAELPSGKKITDLKNTDLKDVPSGYELECVPDAVDFKTDPWATIAKNAKDCVNNPDSCPYKVGDTKKVKVGEDEFTVRLVNLKAPSECNNKDITKEDEFFSQSACGFVVEFADIVTTYYMNDTRTNIGGWEKCAMRTFLNNNIYNLLDDGLKKVISKVPIISGHGNKDPKDFITEDYLYLLGTAEVLGYGVVVDMGRTAVMDTVSEKTRQLDYYEGVIMDYNSHAVTNDYVKVIKKNKEGIQSGWLFRSAALYGGDTWTSYYLNLSYINSYGKYYFGAEFADQYYGVAPVFRIGYEQ